MNPSRTRKWVAAGVIAVTLAAAAAAIVLAGVNSGASLSDVGGPAAAVIFSFIGALVMVRRPENRMGWLFAAVGVVSGLGWCADQFAIFAAVTRPGTPGATLAAWYGEWYWVVWIVGNFVLVPLLFPDGRPLSPRWAAVGWVAGGTALVVAALQMVDPTLDLVGTTRTIDNPIGGPWSTDVDEGGVVAIFLPIVGASILAAAASLLMRFRRADAEQRLQFKWVVFGGVVTVLAMGVGIAYDVVAASRLEGVDVLVVLTLPVTAGLAVLKYRLYDIDLVINKTLVYGALGAFITTVYVGVVVGIGNAIGTRGQPNLPLQVAATALVAVAFQPVRARVQHLANRLVYGKRATPYEVMASFGARMAGSIDVEHVLPRTAEAAARGVGASGARVRLLLPEGNRREAHWPEATGGDAYDVVLSVTHRGEEVGEIAVAKPAGDPLRPAEEALLRDLASQAGLALHNVRLTTALREQLEEISRQAAELRESQARIVTAADEERRRLERTMEERVERRLDDVAADLRQALSSEAPDGEALAAHLERLRLAAQETLEDLREIARGIYPPLLADQGLAAALEAQVRKTSRPVHLSVNGLTRYRQEVEAGLYFCCLEAIAGGVVGMNVREADGSVELAINGRLPVEPARRIRDRIEALGGTVEAGLESLLVVVPVVEEALA